MDTKDIVIAVLVIILVFVVGLVFGQRKSHKSTDNNLTNYHENNTTQTAHDVVFEAVSAPKAKPVKDYSREFSFLADYEIRVNDVYLKIVESHFYEAANEQYQKIDEAYEIFNPEKEGQTIDEYKTLFTTILKGVSFDNVPTHIQSTSEFFANALLTGYQEDLDAIFKGRDFENLSSKYSLSSDFEAEQHRKISSIIAGKFNMAVMKTREFDQRKAWLLENYAGLEKATSGNSGWGSFAKSFAGGALAVANPLIGIPMLFANFAADSNKDKQAQEFIEIYAKKWEEFESNFQSLRQEIINATEKSKEYCAEKSKEINLGIVVSLKDVSAVGHSIDHYFAWIKKMQIPQLVELEKEFS